MDGLYSSRKAMINGVKKLLYSAGVASRNTSRPQSGQRIGLYLSVNVWSHFWHL
jgi:hypothetical protein